MKYIFSLLIVMFLLYAALWFSSRKTYAIDYGVSFNQKHAESLGLDWKEVYSSMLKELGPKYIRIAAMWSEVEKEKGKFDFADVDWMMDKAEEDGAKVVLVVGQKAPRWPECHVPEWVDGYSKYESAKDLMLYIERVVERYKDHSALELWQVENEPFIRFRFGECERYRKDLVEEEIKLVRKIDPNHGIMITDSGELSFWIEAVNAGDYFGTTLYRIVRRPNGDVWKHDWLPAAYYRWKAKILGQEPDKFFIAELQAEPWFTDAAPEATSIEEMEKTMNPERLRYHLDYAARVGTPRAYLWGVEWWYWMKTEKQDARYWDMVKERLKI